MGATTGYRPSHETRLGRIEAVAAAIFVPSPSHTGAQLTLDRAGGRERLSLSRVLGYCFPPISALGLRLCKQPHDISIRPLQNLNPTVLLIFDVYAPSTTIHEALCLSASCNSKESRESILSLILKILLFGRNFFLKKLNQIGLYFPAS